MKKISHELKCIAKKTIKPKKKSTPQKPEKPTIILPDKKL